MQQWIFPKDMRKEQGKKLQRKIIPKGKKSLRRSPKTCDRVPENPPETLHEAFQFFGLLV